LKGQESIALPYLSIIGRKTLNHKKWMRSSEEHILFLRSKMGFAHVMDGQFNLRRNTRVKDVCPITRTLKAR
jgi:hypothetical protein